MERFIYHYLDVLRPWDDDKIITLSQNPCQCDLACCGIMCFANLFDAGYYVQYLREVFSGVPVRGKEMNGTRKPKNILRNGSSKIIGSKVIK